MTVGRIPSVEGGIQPTIVDAKGDLIAAVAADSLNRLAVGSNDQVLVADSAASTGLAWKSYGAQFVAGKNKIINGDFGVWQRGTSFTTPNGYTADRWKAFGATSDVYSQQTFTPGTAPVTGYEGTFFYQVATSATSADRYWWQPIEDVRTFANQTMTLSFWAKVSSGTATLKTYVSQNFGSGGSAEVNSAQQTNNLTTTWTRFTNTFVVPSISGKTIGTSSYLAPVFITNATSTTYQIWGVQAEAGSVATPFTTATGTIQGELAACQRYFSKSYNTDVAPATVTDVGATFYKTAFTDSFQTWMVFFPVQMRSTPTLTFYSPADGATGVSSVSGTNRATTAAGQTGASASGIYINNVSIANANLIKSHWTASIEL